MTLKKKSANKPSTFSGSGLIRVGDDGQLTFKLFANRERNANDWDFDDELKAGEIVPESSFYDLTAIDFGGRKWIANRLLPDVNRSATGKAVIEGRLFDLSCKGRFSSNIRLGGSSLTYWIFDNIKIPCNSVTKVTSSTAKGRHKSQSATRNAWKFRSCGVDFLLIKESDNCLVVEASTSQKTFPKYFEERVIESLDFLLGRPVPWLVMELRTGQTVRTIVVGHRVIKTQSRFLPPLPVDGIRDERTGKWTVAHHRRLFDCFLKHTLGYSKMRHPLWGKLHAVYEASASSFIDAKALTLAVAVESLLENEFPEMGKPDQSDQNDIKEAINYVEQWKGSKRMKERIKGALKQFRQPRALDRLRTLAKLGVISDGQWKAWQELRNPSTHSYQSPPYPSDRFIRLIQEVETLFYHLIFYAIGYRGPYMDTSLPDWPIKNYLQEKGHPGNSS